MTKSVRKSKSPPKKHRLSIVFPGDVFDFYRQVAKLADCTVNQAVLVVVAIETLKLNRKEK